MNDEEKQDGFEINDPYTNFLLDNPLLQAISNQYQRNKILQEKEKLLKQEKLFERLGESATMVRDARSGNLWAGQVRNLYKQGKDEEALQLAKNFAVDELLGLSVPGLQKAIPFFKTIPTNISSELKLAKPTLKKLAQEGLVSLAGYHGVNALTESFTGKTFDENIKEYVFPNMKNGYWKDMLAGTLNPGSYLTLGQGLYITNSLGKGILTVGNHAAKQFKTLQKNITANKRRENLIEQILETRDLNVRAIDTFHKLENSEQSLNYRFYSFMESDLYQLYRTMDRLYNKRKLLILNNRIEKNNATKFRPSKVNFDKFNFDRLLDPNSSKYDPDFASHVIKQGENYYTQGTSINNLYKIETGSLQIPVFGTDKTINFEIPSQLHQLKINLKNFDKTTAPEPVSSNSETLPKEYIDVLLHNIEYVLSKFPGAKAYGSSIGVTKGNLPHKTNDIDIYILDTNLNKLLQEGLLITPTIDPNTFQTHLDGGKYGNAGKIDLNVIKTKPDGTLDFTSKRSLNLFRLLFPDEYQKAYLAAEGDLSKMYHPMQANEVLNKVDIDNTIMDAFESTKPHHKSRALWYLNNGDADQVYLALLKHGESFVGKNMKHAPVTEEMFKDSTKNMEILKKLNVPGLESLQKISKDPKRMKLIFEYWWQNNTILSRGTSVDGNFNKYYRRNMTEWSGGKGFNESGTGLNTVLFGNSGHTHNDIYGLVLPELIGFTENMDPLLLINLVEKNYPSYNVKLNSPLNFKNKKLYTYKDILDLKNNISPEELNNLVLNLGIRGIKGNPYHESTYIGVTSPINKPTDVLFVNPLETEIAPTNMSTRYFGISNLGLDPVVAKKLTAIKSPHKHSIAERRYEDRYDSEIPLKLRSLYGKVSDYNEKLRTNIITKDKVYEKEINRLHNQNDILWDRYKKLRYWKKEKNKSKRF